MSIKNIVALQHPEEFSYIPTYSNEYILQSLANLGQRLGIKGDSLIYKYFTFADIFDELSDKEYYEKNDYIGVVKYHRNNDGVYCKFVIEKNNKKYNNYNDNYTDVLNNKFKTGINIDSDVIIYEQNIFNKYIDINNIKFEILINNIDSYLSNVLFLKDNKFVSLLFGKILGTKDNTPNNMEIIYNKFNSETNILERAIRSYYLYSDGNSKYYVLLDIVANENDASKYKLKFYLFNSSCILNANIKNQFEAAYDYTQYNIIDNIFIKNLKENITNEDVLLSDNEYALFGTIINNELNKSINKPIEILLNYNNSDNLYFSINNIDKDPNIIKINDELSKKNNLNIQTRILYLNNDIIYLYPNLLKYYTESQFNLNKSTLCKRILCTIYEYLHGNNENLDYYDPLYIPLDYKFRYICNSNNLLQIYNSNDTYINLMDLTKYNSASDIKELFSETKGLICDTSNSNIIKGESVAQINNEPDKIINIQYYVDYNVDYSDYINSILINLLYTLPYLTPENTWAINDIDSNISALGKDAGVPNIVILYNYKVNGELKSKIVSGSNLYSYGEEDFIRKTFEIDPQSIILEENTNLKTINYECKLPLVTEYNYDILKYALIISICDQSCNINNIKTSDFTNYTNYVTSFWRININDSNSLGDNGYYQFNYIKNNDLKFIDDNGISSNYALDMTSLLNINDIINTFLNNQEAKPTGKFDNVLLTAKNNILKQEQLNPDLNDYALICNLTGAFYKKVINEIYKDYNTSLYENINYYNDLNLNIKYIDNDINNAEIKDEQFAYLFSSKKYINKLSDINKNTVTNSLYPKFEADINTTYNLIYQDRKITLSERERNKVLQYIVTNYIKPMGVNITNIVTVKDDGYTFEIKEGYEKIFEEVQTISENYTIDGFYDEYVFNTNVPIVDLQDVIVMNDTVLNKVNILSINENGELYNSYIGTRYDNQDKSILTIGSSNTNINLGSNSLISAKEKTKLNIQDTIDINFKNINLNGDIITNSIDSSGIITLNNDILIEDTSSINTYNVIESNSISIINTDTPLFNNLPKLGDSLNYILYAYNTVSNNTPPQKLTYQNYSNFIHTDGVNAGEIIQDITSINLNYNINNMNNLNTNVDYYKLPLVDLSSVNVIEQFKYASIFVFSLNNIIDPYLINKGYEKGLGSFELNNINIYIMHEDLTNGIKEIFSKNTKNCLYKNNQFYIELCNKKFGTMSRKYNRLPNGFNMCGDKIKIMFYINNENKIFIYYLANEKPIINNFKNII